MANQLDGSKRSNQIYELDSIRYLREETAADIFGLLYSTVLYFAQAAGAVYHLPKITLIHRKKMEEYMNHLHKVPNTGKYRLHIVLVIIGLLRWQEQQELYIK